MTPRFKITSPADFIFSTELTIKVSDLNYGNHLGHDRLISLLHNAREDFLRKHDFSELNIDGCSTVVTHVAATYKSQANYGDRLTIKLNFGEVTSRTFEILYVVFQSDSMVEVARASTVSMFYSTEKSRAVSAPKVFLDFVKQL